MIDLNNDTFQSFIKENNLVIVDFWAPWCGPCKMMTPILSEIENEFNEIKVAKVNVEKEKDLSFKFMVRSIPTIMIIKNGIVKKVITGAIPKQILIKEIKTFI